MKKYREFYVHMKNKMGDIELSKNVFFCMNVKPVYIVDHEVIHVIEHSALQESEARCKMLVDALKNVKSAYAVYPDDPYNKAPGASRLNHCFLVAKEALEAYEASLNPTQPSKVESEEG